jgi:hypothetical protein
MALNTGKKIICRSWDVIPMPDLMITQVNALGSDQPPHTTFTDRHGRLMGNIEIPGVDANDDDNGLLTGAVPVITYDIKIPGVDVEGPEAQDEVPAPQVEIDDLDIPHDDPAPIEVAPTNPSSTSPRNASNGRTTDTGTWAPYINESQVSGESGVHSEHDRLKLFICSNPAGELRSAQS